MTQSKILDALQDGELLARLGFDAKHEEAIENAYEMTMKRGKA